MRRATAAFPIASGVLTQAMQRGNDEVLFWCIDGTFDDTSKSRCSSHAGAHDGWAHLAGDGCGRVVAQR